MEHLKKMSCGQVNLHRGKNIETDAQDFNFSDTH